MYPLTALHFRVDWGGEGMNFSEVSGLTVEAEVVEYRGGDDKANHVSKLPGLRKAGNVTLKRGTTPSENGNGLFEWYAKVLANQVERRDVSVMLLNEELDPAMTWKLRGAWPAKLEGPGLNSTGNEVAIETLELACESIEIETA